ncbi:IS982 family transposase, partial [Candidatus Acetothermia bacterium]|nr:IS982 family transposase [Candidatus Acetothermia bacterium]
AVGWTHWLTQVRRRIETVIGQLVERYRAKRTWARDLWHLGSRIFRKVVSHTIAVWLSLQRGGEPLQFDHLLAH